MAATSGVSVIGVDALVAKFAKMAAIAPAAAKLAEGSLAEEVARVAKVLVPVDTGRLQDSIHVETSSEGTAVVADERYAVFVEFGTALHGEAQPFMRPAADEASETLALDQAGAFLLGAVY